MVKSGDDGSPSVAPFLKKCYEMVDDESTNSIISWSQNSDTSFVIWDMTEFSVQLLPKYFKHSNSSSFVRQLNIYGFRKIDADRWEFANDGFVRGQKHLLKNICRRKNSQSTNNMKLLQQQDKSIEPCDKIENDGLWKEIENLKTDRNSLMQELVKLRQHQENASNKLLLLRDRVQGMEKNQQQMLSFLVIVMQSPGFLVQLLHPKENNWRMAEPGTIVEQGADEGQLGSDGMIIRYQPPQVEEMPTPIVSEIPQASNPLPDMRKDSFLNPDFVKLLMEENLSFENHAPFALPELPDDSAWEQFLLATPFLRNIDDTKHDSEGLIVAENETEAEPCRNQVDQLDGNRLEKSENMEIITEQMALLAAETNQKNGLQ